jgi:hypothetical protein
VCAEGRISEKGGQDCYGHEDFKQLGEEKLRLKITLKLKFQTLKYVQMTQSKKRNDQTYIRMQLQQLHWILHFQAIQCKRENITRALTKTGHDTILIKPTLQQHNNPRLDPPC